MRGLDLVVCRGGGRAGFLSASVDLAPFDSRTPERVLSAADPAWRHPVPSAIGPHGRGVWSDGAVDNDHRFHTESSTFGHIAGFV
jgi:hypothetical protein